MGIAAAKVVRVMALLCFMKVEPQCNGELPDPAGPLSSSLLSLHAHNGWL